MTITIDIMRNDGGSYTGRTLTMEDLDGVRVQNVLDIIRAFIEGIGGDGNEAEAPAAADGEEVR